MKLPNTRLEPTPLNLNRVAHPIVCAPGVSDGPRPAIQAMAKAPHREHASPSFSAADQAHFGRSAWLASDSPTHVASCHRVPR